MRSRAAAEVDPSQVPKMSFHTRILSQLVGSELYVFGGLGAGSVGEFWKFDIQTLQWERLMNGVGVTPEGRHGHTLTRDPDDNLWLFGGQAGSVRGTDLKKESSAALRVRMIGKRQVLNDLHMFDTTTRKWYQQQMSGATPSPRRGHTATLVQGRRPQRVVSQEAHHDTGGSLMASLESHLAAKAKVRPHLRLL